MNRYRLALKCGIWVFSLGALLSLATATRAQTSADVFSHIAQAIKENEPAWKLIRKRTYKNSDSVLFEWKSKKRTVGALIRFHASSAEAIRTYQGINLDFEAHGLTMLKSRDSVPNLGDQSYVWEDSSNRNKRGVDFRKGKAFVHVSAQSIEIAQRFAAYIAAEIPDND